MLLALLALAGTALEVASRARHHTVDDGLIVARYVHNITVGDGWVWQPGVDRNACTSTLHVLSVTALAMLRMSPETAEHVLGAAALLGSAVAVLVLLLRSGRPAAAVGLAVLLPVLPFWYATWGLETPLLTALLFAHACVVAAGRTRWWLVYLVFLVRPDCALLVVTSAVRERRRTGRWPVRGLAGVGAAVAAWSAVLTVLTGAPLPSSLSSKVDQGRQDLFRGAFDYLPEAVRQLDALTGGRRATIGLLALAVAGVVLAVRRHSDHLVELAAFVVLQTGVYAVAGLPGYYWYYVPLELVLLLLAASTVEAMAAVVGRSLTRRSSRARHLVPAGCLTLALGLVLVEVPGRLAAIPEQRQPREQSYFDAAAWLLAQGPVPSLGVGEVGAFGVALPDTDVVDLAGLVSTPAYYVPSHVAELFAQPPLYLVLHYFGGPPGRDAPALVALERESGLTLSGEARPPGQLDGHVWGLEEEIVASPLFVRYYELVHVVLTPGAPAQPVFRLRALVPRPPLPP